MIKGLRKHLRIILPIATVLFALSVIAYNVYMYMNTYEMINYYTATIYKENYDEIQAEMEYLWDKGVDVVCIAEHSGKIYLAAKKYEAGKAYDYSFEFSMQNRDKEGLDG